MLDMIAKITIYSNDVMESKKFWTEKMGFVIREEKIISPTMVWLEVAPTKECETVFVLYSRELMKQQDSEVEISHPSIILHCSDIESTYQRLKDNGVELMELQRYPYGVMCTFFDCDHQAYVLKEK